MEIKPITPADYNDIHALLKQYFCDDPAAKEVLDSHTKDNSFGFKAVVDGKMAGFAIEKDGMAVSLPEFEQLAELKKLAVGKNIASVSLVCVADEYGGHGLNKKLRTALIDEIKARGFDTLYAESVVPYIDGAHDETKQLNYSPFCKSDYYKKFVPFFYTAGNFYCPLCKDICKCGTTLFLGSLV